MTIIDQLDKEAKDADRAEEFGDYASMLADFYKALLKAGLPDILAGEMTATYNYFMLERNMAQNE